MGKLMRNKKGDLPIAILTIGVFVLCGLVIFSFVTFTNKIQIQSVNINFLEKINLEIEEFHFYINSGMSAEEAAELINAEVSGNVLIIERNYGNNFVRYTGSID